MTKTLREYVSPPREQIKLGLDLGTYLEHGWPLPSHGHFIFDMRDEASGDQLEYWEKDNLITLDAGILAARLFKDTETPVPGRHNGITMLAVGSGATGNILSPDAPQPTQRKLNTGIWRKQFASSTYRTSGGVAVAYPTNIVDFTTTFNAAEAVGPLNEMGLMYTASLVPGAPPWNPINNGPSGYDPTIDVTGFDVMINYTTFSVVSKPSTAILTITWRLTF
jgi:hypothetical protein